jgi:hypothetical protein
MHDCSVLEQGAFVFSYVISKGGFLVCQIKRHNFAVWRIVVGHDIELGTIVGYAILKLDYHNLHMVQAQLTCHKRIQIRLLL